MATGAEETAASSEELAAQAEHMREAVQQLKALAQRGSKKKRTLEQGITTPRLPAPSATAQG
ncbi:hypothetical protein [Dethiosulfatarculus sandiegensis]|uniref:Uncharacterized protein n=1 Tax=Dethiosulfatarculus sandiegensis TaxID=1429043 RepID=A0A0D2HU09_9BACT|nr:hypothetical protein [Dethiosulfatarculus sandiegensis]KIX13948.1 hypothetical protein X474_12495 [Dethiosulfatarculus sandiegensis]